MSEKKHQRIDYTVLALAFALVLMGILTLAGAAAVLSQEDFGKTTYYLYHQGFYGIILGIILGFVLFNVRLASIQKWAFLAVIINLVAMLLVLLPKLGVKAGGASRWLDLGFISFQPSEFLKLTFIIYLSCWLANRSEHVRKKGSSGTTLLPFIFVVGFVALLVYLQSDVGTLAIIMASALLIYFSANTAIWHTLFIFTAGLGALYLMIKTSGYRMKRIQVFFNPELDPLGIGYQIKQALIAIGSGGIFGLGLGMSGSRIPHTISDSIFAIFAQETGFLGSLVLIFIFVAFAWRSFKIARNVKDKFSSLFAVGFSSWIIVQAFVNIGAMVSVVPLTGIPLPFMSYGGSHFIAEMVGLGILLNISRTARK